MIWLAIALGAAALLAVGVVVDSVRRHINSVDSQGEEITDDHDQQ